MSWLQGFQKIAWNHTPGIPTNRPARAIVFHTTEGGTESGAFSVSARRNDRLGPPHS